VSVEIPFPVEAAQLLTVAGVAVFSGLLGEWLKRYLPDWRWTNLLVLAIALALSAGALAVQLYAPVLEPFLNVLLVAFAGASLATFGYETIMNLLGVLGVGVVGWIGLFVLKWLLNRTWQPLGLNGPADVAGLPYVLAIVAIATTLTLPVYNSLSRVGERQADNFSLVVSQKPEVFIDLFERFAVQNLSVVDVPIWEKLVFYTHPPIVERIDAAETFQKQ